MNTKVRERYQFSLCSDLRHWLISHRNRNNYKTERSFGCTNKFKQSNLSFNPYKRTSLFNKRHLSEKTSSATNIASDGTKGRSVTTYNSSATVKKEQTQVPSKDKDVTNVLYREYDHEKHKSLYFNENLIKLNSNRLGVKSIIKNSGFDNTKDQSSFKSKFLLNTKIKKLNDKLLKDNFSFQAEEKKLDKNKFMKSKRFNPYKLTHKFNKTKLELKLPILKVDSMSNSTKSQILLKKDADSMINTRNQDPSEMRTRYKGSDAEFRKHYQLQKCISPSEPSPKFDKKRLGIKARIRRITCAYNYGIRKGRAMKNMKKNTAEKIENSISTEESENDTDCQISDEALEHFWKNYNQQLEIYLKLFNYETETAVDDEEVQVLMEKLKAIWRESE